MGTGAVVVQVTGTNWPKPLYTLLVTGLCRFRIDKIVMEEPYLITEVTQLDKPAEQGIVASAFYIVASAFIKLTLPEKRINKYVLQQYFTNSKNDCRVFIILFIFTY